MALSRIADQVGTPAYVYSTSALKAAVAELRQAISAHPDTLGDALIAFAVKANSNLSVLKTLAQAGCGADTVSEGEIRRALAAGIAPGDIIFSGVGKTDAELAFAIDTGVRQINIESAVELDRLIAVSASSRARHKIAVAVRVNPRIGAGGHAKITTGGEDDKFGVPLADVADLYARAAASPHVVPVGLACHIGSQIVDLDPLERAFAALRDFTVQLRQQGLSVTRLDLGGGLGVDYGDGAVPPSVGDYVATAARVLKGLDVEVAFEPGRLLAARAGVLLSRVIQVNARSDGRRFLVLDAAMNDLLRPSLYEAHHGIVPVDQRASPDKLYDVVGPVCETGDTFARDRELSPVEAGDLVVFTVAGAYGATMASEYNTRPLVPEVLVVGDQWAVVRSRPTYDEILAREPMADWLKA